MTTSSKPFLTEEPRGDKPPNASAAPNAAPASSLRKVLVIDDNPEDRTIFRRFLTRGEERKYDVLEAETVHDGLEAVRAERPDCAVVDYSLTDANGIAFLEEVAQSGLDTAVIMLTGTGNAVIAVQAMKTGADDYLSKTDITAERLRRAVDNAIEKRDLEKLLAEQQRREMEARGAAERAALRLTLALDAADQAIYDWDVSARTASWSDRLPSLFGLPDAASAGEPRALFRRILPADRPAVCATLRSVMAAPGPFRAEFRVFDGADPAAEARWVAVSGRVAAGGDGRPERITGVLWDITDRRRAEEAIADVAQKQARIAETLQRAMLLTPAEDAFPGLEVETRYEPAWDEAQIGGDFFDAFAVDERRVALVVGDVTGKGLGAAAYTAEVKFGLRALIRDTGGDVAAAMERMNSLLLDARRLEKRPHDSLVAAAAVVVDSETGEAVCACAGAEPPLLLRAAAGTPPEEVESYGVLLGALPLPRYHAATLRLSPGDALLLTTDGITEARRPDRSRFFGYDGLTETAGAAFAAGDGGASPDLGAISDTIIGAARAYAGGRLSDDVCLLLARRRG